MSLVLVNGQPYVLPEPADIVEAIFDRIRRETPLQCRSRASKACDHGRLGLEAGYEDGDWSEDGTFDGRTIICTPCYVKVGMPLNRTGRRW